MVRIGALGLLARTTGDFGAAAGRCGVITQGGFLNREGCVLRSKFTPCHSQAHHFDQTELKYWTRHQQLVRAPDRELRTKQPDRGCDLSET